MNSVCLYVEFCNLSHRQKDKKYENIFSAFSSLFF